jgi:uncharacterized protein YkwD
VRPTKRSLLGIAIAIPIGIGRASPPYLRSTLLTFCVPLLILGAATCGDDSDPVTPASPIVAQTTIEQRVHVLVNRHRDSLGLAALEWSELIAQQCRLHSYDMATGVVAFGHDGYHDRDSIINDAIPHTASAENVVYTRDSNDPALAAVQTWLASSGHRANIEGNYNMTGVGVVLSNDGRYYFTQFFVRAR